MDEYSDLNPVFGRGQLIVPDENLNLAFYYVVGMALDPSHSYRVATEQEFIYWNKHKDFMEVNTFGEYKKAATPAAQAVHASHANQDAKSQSQQSKHGR